MRTAKAVSMAWARIATAKQAALRMRANTHTITAHTNTATARDAALRPEKGTSIFTRTEMPMRRAAIVMGANIPTRGTAAGIITAKKTTSMATATAHTSIRMAKDTAIITKAAKRMGTATKAAAATGTTEGTRTVITSTRGNAIPMARDTAIATGILMHTAIPTAIRAWRISSICSRICPFPSGVRAHALAVYRLIAQAESHAHGQPISQIHFHEVGSMDAVADVVGVCMLMERIGAQRILASAVHVGSGQVRCAHGVLPVPAPATAHILQGVPTYGGEIAGELCTPTGAALLRHFAQGFGPMPALCASAIGYGMGTKDFAAANCVRAFLGDDGAGEGGPNGEIALLCCNLDDMPGEDLGFAQQALLSEGALDVYTLPIGMKKSRPAVLLCCICEPSAADRLAAAILRHTSTFGVRKTLCQRYMLSRSFEQVSTPHGDVRIKTGQGYGVSKSKPEYEDIARIAREQGISLAEARALLA